MDMSGLGSVSMGKLIAPACVIAFLCAIESLLSATVADGMTGTAHDPNQELVGQGVANIASAVMGGLPATGAIARTAASINNGAKSPLAGIFHAVFLLVMYVVLMPVVKFIPLTGLAAILITVSIRMANFPVFLRLIPFGVRDGIVLIVTCMLTVFFDLTYGVIGGFVLCLAINAHNIMHHAKVAEARTEGERVTLMLNGAVYFLSVNSIVDQINKHAAEHDEIAIDMNGVSRVDVTSAERLSKLGMGLKRRGKSLTFINANGAVSGRCERFAREIL